MKVIRATLLLLAGAADAFGAIEDPSSVVTAQAVANLQATVAQLQATVAQLQTTVVKLQANLTNAHQPATGSPGSSRPCRAHTPRRAHRSRRHRRHGRRNQRRALSG